MKTEKTKFKTRHFALPLNRSFASKCLQLADLIRQAKPGDALKLELFESDEPGHETILMCHDIIAQRPKGVRVHIHSYSKLVNATVLVWLAGDTRSLRSDAWIYFPTELKPEFFRFVPEDIIESMQKHGETMDFKADRLNAQQIEKHVRKSLPHNLLGRPVWNSELEEFGLVGRDDAKMGSKEATPMIVFPSKVPILFNSKIPQRLILPPSDPSLN